MADRISFKKSQSDDLHFRNIKSRVHAVIAKLPSHRKTKAQIRAIFLILIYIGLYILSLLNHENVFLFLFIYALMGITAVLIFLNSVHEAVHGTLFKTKWQNQIILYFFDLIGANSYIWKKRHKILHHSFQNIAGWDSDIEQASLFRIYPHDKKKKIHEMQHWLIFIFYPLYLVNWVFVRDFKDYFRKRQLIRKVVKIPRREYYKLFAFKFAFIVYLVVVPTIIGTPLWLAIGALLCMIIVAGSLSLLALLTPHVNTTNTFPLPNSEGNIRFTWLEHQFATTNDLNINNWVTRNILGNFNFHIAHHLFPNISSVFAPEVTSIIQQYAIENGFDYRTYTLKSSLSYHYQLIKRNAFEVEFLE